MTNLNTVDKTVGKATFTNAATKSEYKLSFFMENGETELSKGRSLINTAASINGWNKFDVRVKAGWVS